MKLRSSVNSLCFEIWSDMGACQASAGWKDHPREIYTHRSSIQSSGVRPSGIISFDDEQTGYIA